ncbi:unnamed protein product [Ophioblennius macclurei]
MCNKMSDVRLSNASPTVDRVDARQADNARPPVRRNLFGTPDREEIRRYMAATVQEGVQSFRETYNFDPIEERQDGVGNFQWVVAQNPPEFYLRPPHGRQRHAADAHGDNRRQNAAEEADRQDDSKESRKRRSGNSDSCSADCQGKVLRTDEDDDEDESGCAGSAAVSAAERRPSRPESSAEAH